MTARGVLDGLLDPGTFRSWDDATASTGQDGTTAGGAEPGPGTLPVTGPNLSPTVVLADTLIATGLLLGLVGLIALLQRRARHATSTRGKPQ